MKKLGLNPLPLFVFVCFLTPPLPPALASTTNILFECPYYHKMRCKESFCLYFSAFHNLKQSPVGEL